ncbi:Rgp1-domain-containing protein [Elsinoe ampelina]|uniref:Rgp1-domain-containing protein n=1 Tax=Elsinoe ampelina TaxID=302913 RepID=A0A6A6G6Q6_9PEZI|nr:Rgp1-domain-containing protein [Elsinoe ampelina]
MPSNIRTYVQWKDSNIFAGEDIECILTFKNIARTAQQRERATAEGRHGSRLDPLRPILERQRTVTQSTAFTKPSLARRPSVASGTTAPTAGRGHRPSASMTVAPNTPQTGWSSNTSTGQARPGRAHGRSLSILSLGTDVGSSPGRAGLGAPRRGGHGRSASLQIVPQAPGQTSPGSKAPSVAHHALDDDANTPPLENGAMPRISRRRSGVNTAPTTPAFEQPGRSRAGTISSEFRFPNAQQLEHVNEDEEVSGYRTGSVQITNGRDRKLSQVASPISPGDTSNVPIVTLNPSAKLLSEASINGTPRTSSEFYSLSNVSDETVNSEMPSQSSARLVPRQSLSRSNSRRGNPRSDEPEHLMMGYAQTMGSFSLDGSLVNQAPFEEVKRKGIIGSHGGGGVVGVERSKRESGLFGGLGWSNIGESLTGLLGMDEMSSMREMSRTASTKTIPMLSTPQSILFVDLRLSPGQSKSFTYKFKVPKGLPPSHKGRSIKVVYHLRVAVQRSGSVESQKVKDVEIPFRVLGSVNRDGDILGHDLMSPYILLNDMATTSLLPTDTDPSTFFTTPQPSRPAPTPSTGMDDFLRYTARLLTQQPAGAPLVSPSATTDRRFSTDMPNPRNMKERIDFSILRANHSSLPTSSSNNRFTIARSGQHVAVLTLLRPSFRLGETVLVKIDFRPPASAQQTAQPTYLVTVSLETSERVDPSLALRSATSIARVTRKVHASATETVLFARQATFGLEVPVAATPSFETTGVRLDWRVRVEFTTGKEKEKQSGSEGGEGKMEEWFAAGGLLEHVSSDDRGKILVAKERLQAETFEVGVPIKVFGVNGVEGGGGMGVSDVYEI